MILALLILIYSGLALANPTELLKIKESLSFEMNTVVKQYDPEAHVVVNVLPKTTESKLPGTAFTLKDIVLRNSKGQIRISKVDVTVVTHASELPETVKSLINEIVTPYNVTPEIKVIAPPTALFSIKKFLLNLIAPQNLIMVFALGVLSFLMMVFLRSKSKSDTKLNATIESSVVRLTESIEQASAKAEANTLDDEVEVKGTDEDEASEARNEKLISGLNNDSLVALFADAYWSSKDNYASYLWAKATVDQRAYIVKSTPYMKKYCDLVADMNPVNLNYHQEPYYLEPLNIHHLDNAVIGDQLKKSPKLTSALSRMRFESINLSTKERIEFSQLEPDKKTDWSGQLSKLKPSEERTLRRRAKLVIRTDEEETEVLFLDNITMEMKEDIVTIAWVKDLTVEEVDDILRPYTAQDLASVWVGPPEVLDYMKSALPEKKYNLMSSYLEKTTPSRNSSTYRALHKVIIQRLKQREAFMAAAAEDTELDEAS